MALNISVVPPLDPNSFTGSTRMLGNVARTGDVTNDVAYGEFARWLYVGTTGTLSYVKWDGTTQVLSAVAAGIWHPIQSIMINSAGTSADSIVWGS